jgi:hypothetical protein
LFIPAFYFFVEILSGKRMLKIQGIVVALIFVISANAAIAIDSPFNFLRYVSGARASGLAGSFVAVTDDPAAMYYNPASVSTVTDKRISVTFLKHVLDINSGGISYIHHLEGSEGTLAASVGYTNYGSFDYADNVGNRSGSSFGASDLSFGVTYSSTLDTNFYYGLTLKYIYSGIEEVSTSAVAVDAGLIYRLSDKRTNFGMSILHAGSQLTTISNTSESLPLDVRIGFNHRLRGLPLLFNFSFHHLADKTDAFFDKLKSFNIGGELYFGKVIQVRLGYDNQIRSLTNAEVNKGFTGFSAGVGLVTEDFNFDYGYTGYGSSANLHRFSVSLNVNKLF